MADFLRRVEPPPMPDDFPVDFKLWVSTFVDGLNETISQIQKDLDTLIPT